MYINGIGRTKFGTLKSTLPQIAYEAMLKAIKDSPLTIQDIQAIVVSNFAGGPGQGQLHLNSVIASLLPGTNLPILRVETACASGAMAVMQARHLLNDYDHILVVGAEMMTDNPAFVATTQLAMAGEALRDQSCGVVFPAQYALIASQYLEQYNASHADLSLVSLKNHDAALQNELAHFHHKKVTREMIENSPLVCTPFNLFDCSPLSDGAAALVISKQRHSQRDVEIIGSATATDAISLTQRESITSFPSAKSAAQSAYKMAGITAADIDLAEVHDCFTIAEVLAVEDLGICEAGTALSVLKASNGKSYGKTFVNVDGGLIGDGHPIGASGIVQIYEIVTQIRGEANARQLPTINYALSHNIGGAGGTAVIHIMKGAQ